MIGPPSTQAEGLPLVDMYTRPMGGPPKFLHPQDKVLTCNKCYLSQSFIYIKHCTWVTGGASPGAHTENPVAQLGGTILFGLSCNISLDFNSPRRILQTSKQRNVLWAVIPLHLFALFSLSAHDTNAVVLLLFLLRDPLEGRMSFKVFHHP